MENETKNTIDVIVIAPGKAPEKMTISDELKSFQEIVGGYIEEIFPFEDEVAVVCNKEGKLVPLPQNRALISNETGIVMDIVYGTFFLAYAPVEEESYQDMPPDLADPFRVIEQVIHMRLHRGRIDAPAYAVDPALAGRTVDLLEFPVF